MKGVFSQEESLEPLNSLNSLEHGRILLCFPRSGDSLESLENWVLPEDYCKKDPCNFNTETFVSKVGKPCPTLGQFLASRICTHSWVWENQYEIAQARFCTQSCSQKLANSWSTSRQLPTPWEVAGVFLAIVLWQFPRKWTLLLDGQNRQSPIASVQRTRSTLASHSAAPRGANVKRMNANRAMRIAAQRTQGL